MTRLIDADALPRFGKRGGLIHAEDVDRAPTVEAERVVHGEWENGRYRSVDQTGETYDDGEALICTNCRNGFRKRIVDWRWKYCPNCGARMDGES